MRKKGVGEAVDPSPKIFVSIFLGRVNFSISLKRIQAPSPKEDFHDFREAFHEQKDSTELSETFL